MSIYSKFNVVGCIANYLLVNRAHVTGIYMVIKIELNYE